MLTKKQFEIIANENLNSFCLLEHVCKTMESFIPINKWKLMYYHHPKEIHDSLLEMELTKSFPFIALRADLSVFCPIDVIEWL